MDKFYTFTRNGQQFRASTEPETDNTPPWMHSDGHGPVSKWTTRAKQPGERILASDRGSYRYYDVAEAMRIARRDGWSSGTGTAAERAARAVDQNFRYLHGWCNDDWQYVTVCVELLNPDGATHREYLGMVEDSSREELCEVAHELADQICTTLDDERQTAEYWAMHNVATVK